MKTHNRKINRYPGHDKSLLHLTVTPWLEERYKMVLKEGNAKRIAKYKGINPLDLVIEQPLAIFREDGYFHSTIVARKNGLAFPDPKIQFKTFEDFLIKTDPDKKIYQNSNIPNVVDKTIIETIAKAVSNFPESPQYYITMLKETGNFVLLVFSQAITLDLTEILKTLFKEYDFEELKGEVLNKNDEGYPEGSQSSAEGYVIGKINIKEILLLEKEITIDILNIKLIKELIDFHEYYYNGEYSYNGEITYSGKK